MQQAVKHYTAALCIYVLVTAGVISFLKVISCRVCQSGLQSGNEFGQILKHLQIHCRCYHLQIK